jgi:hypothetical protein
MQFLLNHECGNSVNFQIQNTCTLGETSLLYLVMHNTIYKSSGYYFSAFQLSHHQTHSLSRAIQSKLYLRVGFRFHSLTVYVMKTYVKIYKVCVKL